MTSADENVSIEILYHFHQLTQLVRVNTPLNSDVGGTTPTPNQSTPCNSGCLQSAHNPMLTLRDAHWFMSSDPVLFSACLAKTRSYLHNYASTVAGKREDVNV